MLGQAADLVVGVGVGLLQRSAVRSGSTEEDAGRLADGVLSGLASASLAELLLEDRLLLGQGLAFAQVGEAVLGAGVGLAVGDGIGVDDPRERGVDPTEGVTLLSGDCELAGDLRELDVEDVQSLVAAMEDGGDGVRLDVGVGEARAGMLQASDDDAVLGGAALELLEALSGRRWLSARWGSRRTTVRR